MADLVRVEQGKVYAKQRLYLTEDGKIVSEGDPDSRYLAFPEDEEIPADLAKEKGLVKSAPKAEDKSRKAPNDKGR